MADPTYSYQLKPRKDEGSFYLYLNKVHNGVRDSRYIGQVEADDERAKLILEKKRIDAKIKTLADGDARLRFD